MEISAFLDAVRSDEDLQRQLRGATTAADLVSVAAQAGLTIEPAALVKGFAQLLLEGDDAMAVRNFNNLGWDMGELLWAIKTWEQTKES
ncbi:MAG: Nif11-like leader peptide family natural product precursor [Prochlorococcaceae cyanobacterium]